MLRLWPASLACHRAVWFINQPKLFVFAVNRLYRNENTKAFEVTKDDFYAFTKAIEFYNSQFLLILIQNSSCELQCND